MSSPLPPSAPPPNPKLLKQRDQHVDQWRHNRTFIAEVPKHFHDWAITVAFYTALHAVDALLCHDGICIDSHSGRGRALVTNRRYEQV